MGILEAALDFLGQKNLQNDQQAFNAEQYAKRYQVQVADMKAAGLNPMLSVGQSPGSGPSSGLASTRPGSTYAETNLASAQKAKLESDKRVSDATATGIELDNAIKAKYGLSRAEADLNQVLSNTGLSSAQIHNVESQTQNNISQLKNIQSENERIIRASELLYQQSNLTYIKVLTESEQQRVLRASADKIASETGLNKLDLKAAEQLGNSGRIGKEVKPFFDMLRSLIRK